MFFRRVMNVLTVIYDDKTCVEWLTEMPIPQMLRHVPKVGDKHGDLIVVQVEISHLP